jgi:hypothetical protein
MQKRFTSSLRNKSLQLLLAGGILASSTTAFAQKRHPHHLILNLDLVRCVKIYCHNIEAWEVSIPLSGESMAYTIPTQATLHLIPQHSLQPLMLVYTGITRS